MVSLVIHAALVAFLVHGYRPVSRVAANVPVPRYIELLRQDPRTFTEAPGPEVERAPLTAPLSDANRKATIPEPTGVTPTNRPGDGARTFTPPAARQAAREQSVAQAAQSPPVPRGEGASTGAPATADPSAAAVSDEPFAYRESSSAAAGAVDWRSAIREVGKVASLGGADGFNLGSIGGEKGFAEQGPVSFETQWYDWGDYAQSMVSRIRVNWYGNMPQIIRTGMAGVVSIRFTIHRDGRISDVTIIKSSGVPPYDHAAKKAIELSSPLNALPKDFPNAYERVIATFYYNTEIPGR